MFNEMTDNDFIQMMGMSALAASATSANVVNQSSFYTKEDLQDLQQGAPCIPYAVKQARSRGEACWYNWATKSWRMQSGEWVTYNGI